MSNTGWRHHDERSGSILGATPSRGSSLVRLGVSAVVVLVLLSVLAALGSGAGAPSPSASASVTPAGSSTSYDVTFTESGLPSGTNWTAVLSGTHHHSTTTTIVVPFTNGTYNWSVLAVAQPMAGGVAGWAPNVSAGQIHVFGAPVYINVTFLHGFNVTIHETGLPSLTLWKITLNGTTLSSTDASFTYILPNATYLFTIENPVPGPVGVQYVPAASTYTLAVKGANISRTDAFVTQFYLTTSAAPTAGGTVTPPSGWIVNRSSVSLSAVAAAGYRFLGWTGSGVGNYTGPSPTPTITMAGPIGEVATFAALYTVTFSETGLPVGTSWSVTLNGVPGSSTTSTIAFTEPDGVYPFTVGSIAGYVATPASGSVTVSGASTTVAIVWTPYSYTVTFTESGLPSGTSWSVALNGVRGISTTPSIAFAEGNGTYPYTIGIVPGYFATPASGSVSVVGAPATVSVAWSLTTYSVTFVESGLPTGTNWTVALSGTSRSTTGTSLLFSEPNGTYTFSSFGVAGYSASPPSGSVVVLGTGASQAIRWSPVQYSVSFVASGLAPGTAWVVTLSGTALSNVSGPIVFSVSNGTDPFSIGAVAGYIAVPPSGSIVVNGASVTQAIAFHPIFPVTVTETGLPSGTNWSVVLNGLTSYGNSSVSSEIIVNEPNGSYSFAVPGVPGYRVASYPSSVTVNGAPVPVALAWSASTYAVTFTEVGLPTGAAWSVTLGGSLLSSTAPSISFSMTNGTFVFTVGNASNYASSPWSSSIRVNGASVSETIQFTSTSTYSTGTFLGLSAIDWALIAVVLVLAALLVVLLLRRRRPPATPKA